MTSMSGMILVLLALTCLTALARSEVNRGIQQERAVDDGGTQQTRL